MQELFITSIHINKVRHLVNIDIALSENERKHLILTGKNGSGKTSLLEKMKEYVLSAQGEIIPLQKYESKDTLYLKISRNDRIKPSTKDVTLTYSSEGDSGLALQFSNDLGDYNDYLFVYISTKRTELNRPENGIERITIEDRNRIDNNVSKDFIKYILNLDYQRNGAIADDNTILIGKLNAWFNNFQDALREIYDSPELTLQYDRRNLVINVEMPGRDRFGLHEQSDGYSAFLDILMELLMRMENEDGVVDYTQSAIVLIDEIETHLHVELQKRALPFLTKMFPNAQFIVATHSPFVISSIPNAVVYDLETNRKLGDDLTQYSYSDIVEGYFDVSECSADLQSDFDRYVELRNKSSRTREENFETCKLFDRLSKIPGTSPLSTAFYKFERERNNGKTK
ncbi:MAG: AAA family ATPase [Lachnospiraceae bacterium]|jgi:predicted ATPase|nr:AAA family ATPase [Lachnospiraceae bacterium]